MHTFSWPVPKFGRPILLLMIAYTGLTACDSILLGDLHIEGECVPGEKRCGGDTPESCGSTGIWVPGTPCDINIGKHCAAGACVVTCSAGDIRCADDYTSQVCSPNGDWQDQETCDSCKQCDRTTGRCRTEYVPDDSSCLDANNKCLLSGTCQSGVCTAAKNGNEIECLEAGDCSSSVCDPSTGSCMAINGTPCDDGDVCSASGTCQGGTCMSLPATDDSHARWNLSVAAPSPRFVSTNTAVFDKLTRLMWQRAVHTQQFTWLEAKNYCACLNDRLDPNCEKIPGYPSGWRLPTRMELLSIVHYGSYNAAIDGAVFPATPSKHFWSGSNYDANQRWIVDFFDGVAWPMSVSTSDIHYVRCVR